MSLHPFDGEYSWMDAEPPTGFPEYARTLLAFLTGLAIGGSVVATAGGLW